MKAKVKNLTIVFAHVVSISEMPDQSLQVEVSTGKLHKIVNEKDGKEVAEFLKSFDEWCVAQQAEQPAAKSKSKKEATPPVEPEK